MKKTHNMIENIPAILWGDKSPHLFIAVHGDQSNKEDEVIKILAEEATSKGYQVLSFDLPEHGERKGQPEICNAQNCVAELTKILNYAQTHWTSKYLFGCSIGAYFSMLACKDEKINQALFLSPVVDMKRIIQNMMRWFDVSEEKLEEQGEIATPVKTLYWDYYQYVLQHPVEWHIPTALLYGEKDNLCELDYVRNFTEQVPADMTILPEGEHFFHTESQLQYFREWLKGKIIQRPS